MNKKLLLILTFGIVAIAQMVSADPKWGYKGWGKPWYGYHHRPYGYRWGRPWWGRGPYWRRYYPGTGALIAGGLLGTAAGIADAATGYPYGYPYYGGYYGYPYNPYWY